MTASPLRLHFTVDDLELLPHVEGARYELVGGELYVSTAPGWQHQNVCGDLYAAPLLPGCSLPLPQRFARLA